MTTPIEEFLQEYAVTEKVAGPLNGFGQNFGKAMVGGMGAGAATAAIGVGAMAAKALMNAATKAHSFNQMLEHNPDLAEHRDANPKRFNQMYTSLHSMNPDFAKDPIVAGTYMRQMSESPLNAGGILAQTVGSRASFPSVVDRSVDDASSTAKSHFGRQQNRGGGGDRQSPVDNS